MNQKQEIASLIEEMDAGKFLRAINLGAAAQVKFFQEKIRKIGESQGLKLDLTSLGAKSLIFENIDTHIFYQADIKKIDGGRVKINNVRELRIIESTESKNKQSNFSRSCSHLIECLEIEDYKDAEFHLDECRAQKFRSYMVPENGFVTTWDGITRWIPIRNNVVPEDIRSRLIEAITEALKDNVKVKDGRIVEAIIGDEESKLVIPISELTRRRVVARYMKTEALNAYRSHGFQDVVECVAGLITQNKLAEAVKTAAKLLTESQEFCLLNSDEMKELIGNALAARCHFNDMLVEHAATLFWRTNCKANKDTIVKEWKAAAAKAEHAPLMENVQILESSENFERDYESFLSQIFAEDLSTKEVRAKSYLSALKDIRKVLSVSENEKDLERAVDEYITKLESGGDEVDDAVLAEVEDTLASISSELIRDVETLQDFDEAPTTEEEPVPAFGAEESPLPLPTGEVELPAPPAAAEAPEAAPEVAPEAMPIAAGVERKGKPVSEECHKCGLPMKPINEMTAEEVKKVAKAISENPKHLFESMEHTDAVATIAGLIDKAKEFKDDESATILVLVRDENLIVEDSDPYVVKGLPKASISNDYSEDIHDAGLRVVEMVCECGFCQEGGTLEESEVACPKCGEKMHAIVENICSKCGARTEAIFSNEIKCEGCGEVLVAVEDGEGVEEDQMKGPRQHRFAFPAKGRSSLSPTETKKGKKVAKEDVEKVTKEDVTAQVTTVSGPADEVGDTIAKVVKAMKDTEDEGIEGIPEAPEEGVEEEMEDEMEEGMPEMGEEGPIGAEDFPPSEAPVEPEEFEAPDIGEEPGEEEPEEETGEVGEVEEAAGPAPEEEMEEGKGLPPHLAKYKFAKKGEKKDKDEKGEDKKGPPSEKEEGVTEDNDVTQPSSSGYDSAEAARKDGSGKKMRELPKFGQKDYAGGSDVKTVRMKK